MASFGTLSYNTMLPEDRDIELDESRIFAIVAVCLAVLAGVLFMGVRIGGNTTLLGPHDVDEIAVVMAEVSHQERMQPPTAAGFSGPPPLPYPPVVGGVPGGGDQSSGDTHALEVKVYRNSADAERARIRLLGRGYPAYLVSTGRGGALRHRLRIGDYATLAEATTARDALAQREGLPGELLTH